MARKRGPIMKRFTKKDEWGQTILPLKDNGHWSLAGNLDEYNNVEHTFMTGEVVDRLAELEDEAEQRKMGCVFCHKGEYFDNVAILSRTRVCQNLGGEYVLKIGDEEKEIDFCPFCGRNLRGET